jgi:hypothetical protein
MACVANLLASMVRFAIERHRACADLHRRLLPQASPVSAAALGEQLIFVMRATVYSLWRHRIRRRCCPGGTRAAILEQAETKSDNAGLALSRTRDEAVREIVLANNALHTSLSAYKASAN